MFSNLIWASFRYPNSTTTFDRRTGRVIKWE